ncbi:MAG: YqjK family protein [Burkholderiaceae bacterium]|nr:YqjK family protein [Burkholderiaceae bacterium]
MNGAQTLAQRREQLVARCGQQRAELAAQTQALRGSLALGSVASDLLATVKQNKLLIAGATLAVVLVKPRRILSGLKTGVLAWQTWRNLLPVWHSFRQQS